ncbi:hypothetical protein BC937DRAFT_90628 [Endogone sp. FLAS-F59071]|nr:hypothetical protein BC937DRAFT_90628 [Endogone sp. FLAS-F59071]|eukprot:RUS16938.1 hypothetical protein BC937DRAFT_90628 [Endogone sp. FLAS-F59071]
MVRSELPETTSLPSNWTHAIPLKRAEAHTCGHIPKFNGAVAGCGDDEVILELNGVDGGAVSLERAYELARGEGPDLDGAIFGTGYNVVWIELEVKDRLVMATQDADDGARGQIPLDHGIVRGARNDVAIVVLEAEDRGSMTGEGAKALACFHVPNLDRVVTATANDLGFVKLDAVDALLVTVLNVLGRGDLTCAVDSIMPVFFNHVTVAVQVLPVDEGSAVLVLVVRVRESRWGRCGGDGKPRWGRALGNRGDDGKLAWRSGSRRGGMERGLSGR